MSPLSFVYKFLSLSSDTFFYDFFLIYWLFIIDSRINKIMYFAYLVIFQILADNSSVKYSWKCQGNEMPSRLSDIVSARSSRKWLILGIGLVLVVIICVSISVPLVTASRRNREASSLDIANKILEKFPLIDGWVEILFPLPYDYDTYLAFIYFLFTISLTQL